jgi:hypothetical protein
MLIQFEITHPNTFFLLMRQDATLISIMMEKLEDIFASRP